MIEYFENIPDDDVTTLKFYLIRHINYHIATSDLTAKDKLELAFVKKFFQLNSLQTILDAVDFEVDDEKECLVMNCKEKLKLYVDNEYNKYIKNE